MLAFRGEVSSSLLNSLLELADKRLHVLGCEKPQRKKAFNIFVECLQNLFKHSTPEEDDDSSGVVIMLASEESISIATGNSIGIQDAKELESRLDSLSDLQKEDLRKEYQKQLVDGKLSDLGGAGLGFLDIARKSGQQLEYKFAPLDDERLFFTFNVKVS